MTVPEITAVIAPLAAACSVISGVWSWRKNLAEQRRRDDYNRKQAHYETIVVGLKAVYGTGNTTERAGFADAIRVAWIYCPDEIMVLLNKALATLETKMVDQEAAKNAVADAVAAMRKDLMKNNTQLSGRDFKHIT